MTLSAGGFISFAVAGAPLDGGMGSPAFDAAGEGACWGAPASETPALAGSDDAFAEREAVAPVAGGVSEAPPPHAATATPATRTT
jgi:hypothetical protein